MEKTVLITGASRGIGRETARLFSSEGWQVAVNYNASEDAAFSLVSEIRGRGGSALAVKADVSDPAEVRAMHEAVLRAFGGVGVLVNNAGIAQSKLFTDITDEDWDEMFSVNVKGVFNCCRHVLPSMIRRKKGKIINVSSVWGIVGASCEVHYSAAKAAVIGLTRALAKEVGPSGIQVNCVAPGVVDTDMNSGLGPGTLEELRLETPLGMLGKTSDIANVILFLASGKADFITGQVISPNGGFLI